MFALEKNCYEKMSNIITIMIVITLFSEGNSKALHVKIYR